MTLTSLSMVRLLPPASALLVIALLTCGCDKIAGFKASDSSDGADASVDTVADIDVRPREASVPDADAGCPADANCAGPQADKIAYGSRHACALFDGQVYCWGDNDRFQLGAVGPSNVTPTAVAGLVAPVRDLCANGLNSCAVDGSGDVYCWGDHSSGQLGTNAFGPSSKPIQIALGLSSVAVSCGAGFVCALTTTKNVYCWGRGDKGQLGSNSQNSLQPLVVPKVSGVDELACGLAHCCARQGAAVRCWGDPSSGKLGSATAASDPIAVSVGGFASISSHGDHTCGVNNNGEVYCWGDNSFGQLTGEDAAFSLLPRMVGLPSGDSATSVATGSRHTCASLKSGQVYCWGHDLYGQLGRGARPGRSPQAAAVPTISSAQRVFAGVDNSCATTLRGLYCWGRNTFAQVGDRVARRAAVGAAQHKKLDDVVSGAYHVCGRTLGEVRCWGFNSHAQSAASTDAFIAQPQTRTEPQMLTPDLIGLGAEHTCAANQSVVSCTGRGDGGQLDGTIKGPRVALFLGQTVLTNVFELAAGRQHSCAIAAVGGGVRSLYCWGSNSHGQLGIGSSGGVDPAQPVMTVVLTISAGGDTTCAVNNVGSLYCWGRNDQGQAGSSPSSPVTLPTQVGVNRGPFAQVSVGAAHACAVTKVGAVYCWGRDVERQLGTGSADNGSPTPVIYESLPLIGARKVAAGGRHSCAIQGTSLICWGDNRALQSGQVAIGLVEPKLVPTPGPVSDVVVGASHTCAVIGGSAAGVYCFGDDYFGQLGSGKPPDWAPRPVKIP